ncbi:MAG: hypothetical protein RLZ97_903 [Verrucomicrobiota bacterium]
MKRLLIFFLVLFQMAYAGGVEQDAVPASHDTFIQRGTTANHGVSNSIMVKRERTHGSGGADRIGYLRFDVSSSVGDVLGGSLVLSVKAHPGSGGTPFSFRLFGLPDGHANEAFDESLLGPSNAINASKSHNGGLNVDGLIDLGAVTPVADTGTPVLRFSGAEMDRFITSNTNRHVTFVVCRDTPHGAATYIHSREVANELLRPTLLLRNRVQSLPVVDAAASSSIRDSSAGLVIDGSLDSRWCAEADSASTKSSLTLDLGGVRTVNGLSVVVYEFGRIYKLECSANGSDWELVDDKLISGNGKTINSLRKSTRHYFPPVSARYLRLTSLNSFVGSGMSLWEISLHHETEVDPLFRRIHTLGREVARVPDSSNAGKLKQVVLEVALERALASLQAGEFAHAGLMMEDVQRTISGNAEAMATAVTDQPFIRAIRPIKEASVDANPYLRRMAGGVELFLGTPEGPFRKSTADLNAFSDFKFARKTAEEMDSLFWLFAHPNSPRRHDPEILRRLLRRAHAYIDAIKVHGPGLAAGQLASFYDDFAIAPASIVFREFQALYPGLMPPNANAEWDAAMLIAADNLWSAYRNRKASWVNTDVAIAVELFNFGRKTGRKEMLEKARYFIDDVLTSGRMFDDGGVGYIGTQNESGGYQSTVASYVSRFYEMTGYAPALEILKKMEWYGPVNGPMIDWWTSPSWKHAWNFISGSGQTGEATNGRNPYTRSEMDTAINAPATGSNWIGQQGNAMWYQRGVKPLRRPDFTTYDRNTMGPRSWRGLWNYSGTLRPIHQSEPGHHTLMGCQIMETAPSWRVNAAVMGVFPRLRTSPGPSRQHDGGFHKEGHAWLTSGLKGDCVVTPFFSSMAACYRPHIYGSSRKGRECDWLVRQMWLNLSDRVVGLLEISPCSDQKVFEVQGVIRLGHGGTAYSSPKSISRSGTGSWDYGDLTVKLHTHNYAAVDPEVYSFRNPNAPFTEITLRDRKDGAKDTAARTYIAGDRWRFIVEIRPNTVTSEIRITEVTDTPGLTGMEVHDAAGRKRYRLLYNSGNAAVAHKLAPDWPGSIRIHRSGTRFRPDWLPAPSGAVQVEKVSPSQKVLIQPQGHLVIESLD